jgi:hypothetical protein
MILTPQQGGGSKFLRSRFGRRAEIFAQRVTNIFSESGAAKFSAKNFSAQFQILNDMFAIRALSSLTM